MLRRIAVIIAATLLWCAPLAAQAPDSGKRAPGSSSEAPVRTAPVESAPPATRAASVPPERVEQAAKDSVRALDLQTQLLIDNPQTTRLQPFSIPQEVLWVALALAVALLLYAMRDE